MRFFFRHILPSALVLTLILAGCGTQQKATTTASKEPKVKTNGISDKDEKTIEAEKKYIEAAKMEMLGDHRQALNLYNECLRVSPGNDAIYYEMAKIYLETKDYQNSLASIKNAVKLNPNNTWYGELYADVLNKTGSQKEAANVYASLVKLQPENIDYYFSWAYFLTINNQVEEAISVYDRIETKTGVDEKVNLEKVRLYQKIGKVEKAAMELQKLADNDPSEPKYVAMLADLYGSNGMQDKALEALKKLSALDASNPNAQLALADYYRRNGEEEKSFDALKKAFASKEMDIDMKVNILVGYLPVLKQEKRKAEALELGSIMVATHPKDAKSYALYGDVLSQVDQYNEALVQYQEALKLDHGKFLIWQQVLGIEAELSLNDSLIHDAARCQELFPDQQLPYYLAGVAYIQKKQYTEAIKPLKQAAIIGSDDRKIMSRIYASLGDAYNRLKKFAASDSAYDESLNYDPENIYTLNNYAYYLSIRGDKLEKAAKMAEQVVNKLPANGNYLDTYGWVLYKQKKYAEAKTWLEKAMKNGQGNNGTVLEHYGDTLYQLGEINEAVQYWQKAKDNHVGSENIDKKIADKKIYE